MLIVLIFTKKYYAQACMYYSVIETKIFFLPVCGRDVLLED